MLSRRLILLWMAIGTSLGAQQDSSRVRAWAEIFARARQAENAQDFRLAKTLYDSVIALDPRNSMAYMQRGLVNHNLADEAASRADLEKSVALGNPQAASFLSGPENLAATPVDTLSPQVRGEVLYQSGAARLAQGDKAGAYRMNAKWYERWLPHTPLALLLVVPFTIGLLVRQYLTPRGEAPVDELEPGETLLWSGVPKQSLRPNPRDVLGGVSALVVASAVTVVFGVDAYAPYRIRNLFDLLPVVIVVAVAWQMVSLYFNTLRDRKRSGYLVTDRRVLIARSRSYFIEHKIGELARVTLEENRDGTGTLSATRARAFFDHVPDARQVKNVIEQAYKAHVERARGGQK